MGILSHATHSESIRGLRDQIEELEARLGAIEQTLSAKQRASVGVALAMRRQHVLVERERSHWMVMRLLAGTALFFILLALVKEGAAYFSAR